MAEGDRDNKDELFEDLDKFFAPIQDVEWPEPETPGRPGAEGASSERAATSSRDHEAPASRTVRIPDVEPPADEPRSPGAVDPALAAEFGLAEPPTAEGEPPARDPAEHDDEVIVRPADADERAIEPGVADDQVDLFAEPNDEAAPTGDEGWPSEVAGGVAQTLDEPPGEEPSMTEVEAAADHFAESVRAGTGFDDDDAPGEPSVGPGTDTQPLDALADEGWRPSADAGEAADAGGSDVEQSLLADLDEPSVEQRTVVVGAGEGMGGPSWQEPTSVEIGSDQDRREEAGRDVPAAFLTGLVLAAIALGSLAIGPGAFAIVASIIALVAMGELYAVMHRRHLQPATAVGLVSGALVLAAAYLHGEAAMAAMLAMATVAAFAWFMTVPPAHRRNVTACIAVTLLPVVYVAFLASFALTIVALPASLDGTRLVIAVIVLTFSYDAAAWLVGSVWGNRPLAQSISPRKSVEGAIGATIIVAIIAVIVAAFVPSLDTIPRELGLALVVAVFAPLGDLAESLLKRDLDVKDMGSILPGHGGVLDRIDSLLFVAPAAFLYVRIFL
jgi:phosphatidate cytidylyltransferase